MPARVASSRSFGRFALVAVLILGGARAVTAQPNFLRTQAIAAPEAGYEFVTDVDVDGEWTVAGARDVASSRNAGVVYVYRRTGQTWGQAARLTCPDTAGNCGSFGQAVAVSGTTLAVGNGGLGGTPIVPGFVWIFDWNGTAWNFSTRLDGPAGRQIGFSVALDGNVLVTTGATASAGAHTIDGAYVFERSGATWTRSDLVSGDRTANDTFGYAVDVAGDTICVGAPAFATTTPGAVHVFRRNGASWPQEGPKLVPLATASARIGESCAVGSDTLATGAPYLTTGGQPGSGRAFIFNRAGTTWSLTQTVLPDAGTFQLGDTTAVFGDAVVIGATGTGSTPKVLMFARTGNTWTERLRESSPVAGSAYGGAAATDGATIVVGGTRTTTLAGVLAFYVPDAGQPSGPPGPPTALQSSVSGATISLSWTPPATGGAATGYTLIARTAVGGPVLLALPLGNVTSFSVAAPNGTFVLSLAASNASGTGAESSPVTVTVPQAVAAPGAPTGLAVSVAGTGATFTWSAPSSGGAPAGYTLVAGVTAGFATPIASLPLPVTPTSIGIAGIPPGTYYVRLVATNAGGTGPASNEVTFTIAAPAAPAAPVLQAPQVAGSTVTLTWTAGSGAAPTSYTLTASATPGGPAIVAVPLTGTSITFAGVPSGTYYLRLTASNAAGTSGPSNQVTLVVP
ncbi:MAG: hypothetical protein U0P30_05075 [Vicinamibacterales bacterium]